MFRSKRKRQRAELLANYHKVKSGTFSFSGIERYFAESDKTGVHQAIDDKTYHDLDLDELFMFADRTVSRVGQQYYYHIFRTIPSGSDRVHRFEHLIELLEEDAALKEAVLLQLSRLHRREAYRITTLIHDEYIRKPRWFWVIRTLALTSVGVILLSFWYPQWLIPLILLFATNFIFHFWNKENIFRYSEAIPQLIILNQVAQELLTTSAIFGR